MPAIIEHNQKRDAQGSYGFHDVATCSCGWKGKSTYDTRKSFKAHVRRVTR